MRLRTVFSLLRIRSSGGFNEHGNEPSGSIKGEVFLDQLSDYQLLKMDSAPWTS
jgi:hypothetical protein